VSGINVEVGPEGRIRRDGEKDPAPRAREGRGNPQETGVVGNVLDHVEQTDQVEGPGEWRRFAFGSDDIQRALAGRGQVCEPAVEAERPVLPGEGVEHVTVAAPELEDATLRLLLQAPADRRQDAAIPVLEPEVSFSQPAEDSVAVVGEARTEFGLATHRTYR